MSKSLKFKPDGNNSIILIDGATETELGAVRFDRDTSTFVLRPFPALAIDATFVGADTVRQAEHEHTYEPGEIDIPRNWKIEGDEMVVWNPANDAEVVLNIAAESGPRTPRGIPEIYGQPEMLFEVAMAIKLGQHTLLSGPTGTGKTTVYAWFAEMLNYNLVTMVFTPKTESAHMIGEYLPGPEAGLYPFVYGPVSQAVLLSQQHPTILVLDEMSRIGNVAETAGILPLLDNQRRLEIPIRPGDDGEPEVLVPGDLFIGGTMNPADAEEDEVGVGDYMGVTELDPALLSRFAFHPHVGYAPEGVETKALYERVKGAVPMEVAASMVKAANNIRRATEIRFPVSFRELEGWARAYPYLGYVKAGEVAVARKAHPNFRGSVMNLVSLQSA